MKAILTVVKVLGKPVRIVHRIADAAPTTLCVSLERNRPGTVQRPAGAAKLEGKPLPADVPIAIRPADPYMELKAYQATRRAPL